MYRVKKFYFYKNILNMDKVKEILKNIKNDTKYEFKTKVDEIDVIITITKNINDNYILNILSPFLIDDNYDKNLLYSKVFLTDNIDYILNEFENIKNLKWCKSEMRFVTINDYENLKTLNEFINNILPLNTCSVCLDVCNECLKCNHYICLYCRSNLIKKRKLKCPLCREVNLIHYYEYDNFDNVEESE